MKSFLISRSKSPQWFLWLLILAFLYTGCKNEALIQPGDSLPTAYKKALQFYRNEEFSDAAEAFETVINVGRGTDYAENGHFYLADSYFMNERYLLAADAYRRYITLYPQSRKRETAQFKEALSYYKLSPRYRIAQEYTKTAIERLRIFVDNYPDSEKTPQAAQYIADLRTKLAHKLYYAAELYDRLDQYKAAVIYYGLTIDQYPDTEWAEPALAAQIETYVDYANNSIRASRVERYEEAIAGYEQYLQLFPEGAHREEVEDYVNQAREAIADLEAIAESQEQISNN